MEALKDCPLCQICESQDVASVASRILYSDDKLYVAVDISPLCVGHILIITKEHYFNFYETSKEIKETTKIIMEKIRILFQEIYHSDALFFEHGSLQSGKAGASIDHAHLHVLPFSYDIESILKKLGNPVSCDIFSSEYSKNLSYLYIEIKNRKFLYPVDELPSQYLRNLIGKQLVNPNYDWRKYYLTEDSLERVETTYSTLKGKIK